MQVGDMCAVHRQQGQAATATSHTFSGPSADGRQAGANNASTNPAISNMGRADEPDIRQAAPKVADYSFEHEL